MSDNKTTVTPQSVPWPDADWILLSVGAMTDGVMADDLTPDTLRTCE